MLIVLLILLLLLDGDGLLLLLLLLLGLLLQLMLLLGGLMCLLLLLLLYQCFLVWLLNYNELLLTGSRLCLLLLLLASLTLLLGIGCRGSSATDRWLLLQMLTLVQHQVVLLEERLTALAHVCPHSATTVRVAPVVQQQTVLGRKTFATVGAVVRLGFRLSHDNGLLVLLLLLLLLAHQLTLRHLEGLLQPTGHTGQVAHCGQTRR